MHDWKHRCPIQNNQGWDDIGPATSASEPALRAVQCLSVSLASLKWQSAQKRQGPTMTGFAKVYAKRVPSEIQVVDPQIRKGSSHAHPLQYLHGNPHNQR